MSSETGVEFAPDAAEAIKLANAAAENDQHEDEQQEGQVNGNGGGNYDESAGNGQEEDENDQDNEQTEEGGDDENSDKSKGPQILMMFRNETEEEKEEEAGEAEAGGEAEGEGEEKEAEGAEEETEEKGEPEKAKVTEDGEAEAEGEGEGEADAEAEGEGEAEAEAEGEGEAEGEEQEEGEGEAEVEKKAELDLDDDENAEGEGETEDPPFEPTEEDNIEMDGEPESAQLDDEETNGFKDGESDPEVSASELEPAMVDYPEKKSKKKRKRDNSDSDFDEEFDEYSEYRPKKAKKKKKSKSVKNAKGPPRRKQPKDTLFQCKEEGCEEEFMSETLGDLRIHLHEAHNGDKPTYMDMAEAIVYKLNEKFGSSRTTILKNMMTEYGHWIELNQNQAKAQLKRSLDRGLEIGRVRNGTLGKTGYLNIWLPNKDKRKTLVKKYNRKPSSVHFEDVPEEKYVEEEESHIIMPRLLPRGGLDGPRSTRSGGGGGKRSTGSRGRGRPAAKAPAKDDDEICVVEEKLTPLAKMKAKAYANAKAALAKKLPASFLKSGTTRMVRIGPGGVVRSEEGKIVTTLGRLTGNTLVPPHNKKKMAAAAEHEAKMKAAAAAAAAAAARKPVTSNPLFKEDDDEEDLTCTMCLSSFWYRNELIDHMKNTHNVEKPEKHLKAKQTPPILPTQTKSRATLL